MSGGTGTPRDHRYVVSALVQLLIAPFLVHDWDGFVFTRTVRDFLSGLTPYAVVEADPTYIHVGHAWPPLNTWYAYPPLPLLLMTPTLAVAFGSAAAPWIVRIALKIPCIAGTLALAWCGERLVPRQRVDAWQRLVLYNPFLVFVSAAWGMFDAWMVAFLLLSLALIEARRPALAGVAFGGAALIKLFPLFAAPAMMFYVATRAGWRRSLAFVAGAVGVFVAVSLPFALPHPRGFLLQVLGMHVRRAPQGLSLPAIAIDAGRFGVAEGWLHDPPSFRFAASLTFALTLGVTIAISVAIARARDTPAASRALLGLFLGVLFTSKVLNEQYFVIPVALSAVVWCTTRARWSLFAYRAFTAGALVASLVLGWHVFTFWPAGVSDFLFGKRAYLMPARMASFLHLSSAALDFLPVVISAAALAPAALVGVRRIARDCRAGARILAALARRFAPRVRVRPAVTIAVLVITPMIVQTAALGAAPDVTTPKPLEGADRRVGAFYYLWWANPSHDPAVRDGNWTGVSEKPVDGYYTVSAAKLRNDFRAARANGIDLLVTSFHEYDVPIVPVALQAAYAEDVVMAPLLELGDIYSQPKYGTPDQGFEMNERTKAAIERLASKALDAFSRAPAAYRPNGKLAVFLYDAYFTAPAWKEPFVTRLLDRTVAVAEDEARSHGKTPQARADLVATAPHDLDSLLGTGSSMGLWRRAYAELYAEFWRDIRRDLESRYGPLSLISAESWNPGAPFHHGSQAGLDGTRFFDASFIYSPSFVWVLHRSDGYERNWERWFVRNAIQAQYARGVGHPVIATVNPTYDDRVARKKTGFTIPTVASRGSSYDLDWQLALDLEPDLVLVSTWNEFFEGSAIEPTIEHGDLFLKRTGAWAKRLRAAPRRHKRALVLTGEASAHFTSGEPDPSVEGRYAHNMQALLERNLADHRCEAMDVGSPDAEHVDLARYDLVVVEPGIDAASLRTSLLVERLEQWAATGGHVLVSSAPEASAWQKLVHASGAVTSNDAEHVSRTDGSVLSLAPGSRPSTTNPSEDARIFLRYADGEANAPAAWVREVGHGAIVGTSFHVTGRQPYPGDEASTITCLCLAPLLASDDRCGNADSAVMP